jgi:hypothetical protein
VERSESARPLERLLESGAVGVERELVRVGRRAALLGGEEDK